MGSTNITFVSFILGFFAAVGVAFCIVFLVIRVRRFLRARSSRAYADPQIVAVQDEGEFGVNPHAQAESNRRDSGPAHRLAYNNSPIPGQSRRDNYADRDAVEYRREGNVHYCDLDGSVRPASPNAERVEGVPIETRVRPRRNLPRAPVVVHHGDQEVYLDFRGVTRVPQAGPPPLTLEEKQRLEDAQNRVASPEFYGRAEYEFRRASNRNTPTVQLSPSLLRDLQHQYGAASASAHSLAHYRSEGSVGSMSFRHGSPAGSARRARHNRQGTNPNSFSLPNGSIGSLQVFQRHNKSLTRNDLDSSTSPQKTPQPRSSPFSVHRHRHDDLESTSDDFEDASLQNNSFDARCQQLREFLLKQEQQMQGQLSPMSGPGNIMSGFDQMSLFSTSPVFIDRPGSPGASVASGGLCGLDGVRATAGSVSPLEDPSVPSYLSYTSAMVADALPSNISTQNRRSRCATATNSSLVGLRLVTSNSHVDLSVPPSGAEPTLAGASGRPHSSAKSTHSLLLANTESASAHHHASFSGAGKGSVGRVGAPASLYDTPSPKSNHWSGGLRSPFSVPSNDPVTASDS